MKREVFKAYSDKMKRVTAFFAKAEGLGGVHNVQNNIDKYTHDEVSLLEGSDTADNGISYIAENINGITTELITPDNISGKGIIFYIHGGAFTFGDVVTSRPVAAALAKESGLKVYTVSYRLAPEHKFPAAVDDCFTVYQEITSKHPNEKIAIVGESAGANCAMSTTLLAKKHDVRLPSCIVLISYPGDFTQYVKGGTHESDAQWLKVYTGDETPTNPLISPNLSDIKGFPPLFIIADANEAFRPDCDYLAEKADKLGIDVLYHVWDETFHAFPAYPTSAKDTPETEQVIKHICSFISSHLS